MKSVIITFWMVLSTSLLNAQTIEIGGSFGGATYQGDISHLSSKLSIEGARFLKGLHVGYLFSEYASLKFKWSNASLRADDKGSADFWRVERNLHFRTDIRELALVCEFELLDVFKSLRKYRIKPFVNFGVALFTFNPQASFKGQWYDLQPLGTEGQGLPGYGKPYSLNQISLPFGFGFKYFFNEELYIAFEISPRITFTDYLDDVSSKYPDFELLRQHHGDVAVQLSYQADKRPGGKPLTPDELKLRGNPNDNDWYIFNSLIIGYKFNVGKYLKGRKSFRQGRKCHF
ncbi:MAG: hypothetical protein H7X99_09150 [Saprospiraceae bacterium]|nr:hypothetical protein [Saprospiraceae bacterium]